MNNQLGHNTMSMSPEELETLRLCERNICVFHAQNTHRFTVLEEKLERVADALTQLDKDLLRVVTGNKVRIGIVAAGITLVLAMLGVGLARFDKLEDTVYTGRDKRLELQSKQNEHERRIIELERDTDDLKKYSIGYNQHFRSGK